MIIIKKIVDLTKMFYLRSELNLFLLNKISKQFILYFAFFNIKSFYDYC